MSLLQLDPTSLARRAAEQGTSLPGLGVFIRRGLIGFTLLSLAGFAPWALFGRWFYRHLGEAGLYAICALVFIGLSGPLLHRLILGSGSLSRFYQLFSLAFGAYSVAWIAGWMWLKGDAGSLVGLLAGTALMGSILTTAFEAREQWWKVVAALFLLNTLGYFVGGWIEAPLASFRGGVGFPVSRSAQMMFAKLQWGFWYGAGLGAGLGVAFYLCQSKARALLASKEAPLHR